MKTTIVRRVLFTAMGLALVSLLGIARYNWLSSAQQARSEEVARVTAPATVFTGGAITINSGAITPASPYPSTISVSGLTGTITKVTVTLTTFSHLFPDDVDMLLVGPTGAQALIMSDVGGSTCTNCPVTLTLDDAAASALPNSNTPTPLASGTFRPADYSSTPTDSFPMPAPALSATAPLSVFNGTAPNGTWSLYVVDDNDNAVSGTLGSWSLDITASAGVCTFTQGTVTQAKDPNFCGAIVNYGTPATTGACTGISCSPPTGSYFPLGMTTVNCTADGAVSGSFTVNVTGTCPPGQICNSTPITLADNGTPPTSGAPYPSNITVSGLTGQIVSNVTVTLANFSHSFPDNVDILLVGPGGQNAILMSDVGGGAANAISPNTPVTLTLSDAAAMALPDATVLTTGAFQPANYNGGDSDTFGAPAPAPAGGSALSVFNGTDPNGTWSLYVVSDSMGNTETGRLANGWCLNITTTTPGPCAFNPVSPVMQAKDPNFCGAVVSYPTPTTTGGCNPILCAPPSGSYFTLGTTTVNCAEQSPGTATTSFMVTVSGTCPTGQLCNNATVTLIDGATAPVQATPYPSTINVSGLNLAVSKVTVTLANYSHSRPDNVDLLLVGPQGQRALLMSDVGGSAATAILPSAPVTLTLDDAAATPLPDSTMLSTGTFRPANYNGGDADTIPGQTTTVNAALSVFNNTDPNGTWSLYAVNDATGDSGQLFGGWCLNFTLAGTLTTLTLDAVTGNSACASTPLRATLKEKLSNTPLASRVISFTFNGNPVMPVATATTDSNGVATVNANLGAVPSGMYPITASFAGEMGFSFSNAANILTNALVPITLPGLPNGALGTAYNQSAAASPAGTYTYSVMSGIMPTGLTLNPATGAITGTPTVAGTFTFTLKATDPLKPCLGTRDYIIVITCPPLTFAPTLANGVQGTAYNQSVVAAGGSGYTYAVTSNILPPGLTLNPATGAITGTPSAAGNYAFVISATASGCSSKTQSYNVLITGTCATITVNPATLPNGTLGTAYPAASVSATGGIAPYTFSITQGALPAGLALDTNSGAITGTPTAAGAFSFRVTATAVGGCNGSRVYVLSVSCATLTFSPAVLPNGAKNVSYNQAITVAPVGSYTFSLQTGSLPPGYTLNTATGVLSGITNQSGVWTFTVRAQTGSCSGTKQYTLTIPGMSTALAQFTDYDGDGRADLALFSANGAWRIQRSSDQQTSIQTWGTVGDVPLSGDYDGDRKTDLAVFRPSDGTWYIKRSSDGGTLVKAWGLATDIPVPGDYDGDGKTDIAVWRAAEGNWYVVRSSDQQPELANWGNGLAPFNDVPVAGDYDGDGRTDLGVFRRANGVWFVRLSAQQDLLVRTWGLGTDVPVVQDYDGDGKVDIAVWRGSNGTWYIQASSDGALRTKLWGAGFAPYNDQAVPGDYDGDGQADLAIWRTLDATWYLSLSGPTTNSNSATRTVKLGAVGDKPVGVRLP